MVSRPLDKMKLKSSSSKNDSSPVVRKNTRNAASVYFYKLINLDNTISKCFIMDSKVCSLTLCDTNLSIFIVYFFNLEVSFERC